MKYLFCSLKYFVALCVLCVGIMFLNVKLGIATLSMEDSLYVMFHTPRGLLLPVAMVLAAAFYPKFGFITRRVEGFLEDDRTEVINAMKDSGFELKAEDDEGMTFEAKSHLKKLMMLYEDKIKVSQYGQWIEIQGNRRGVARIVYLLDSFLSIKKRND